MSCSIHTGHDHKHGPNCGHTAVKHDDHIDYLHDKHLHHVHDDHVDCHHLAIGTGNPSACTPSHNCDHHDLSHKHGEGCGHEAIPHSDHIDYLVNGHLHSPCQGHCDDHGKVEIS